MQEFLSIKQSATRFCTSIATIIIAVHIIACIWYYVSKLDDFNPDTWVVRGTYMDSDISTLYITCLYWAFTTLSTVGYGDISGYTIAEKVICISWMLVGLYFLGFTIGSLSSMSASIDTKEKGLSRKLAAIDEFITDTKLDRVLAHKLRHAIKYSSKITGFSWTDKQNIFNELPKSLKSDVCKAMHHGAAKHISFFVDKDSSIVSSIIPFLIPLGVLKDDIIYKQSDPADEIYFLVRGTVEYVFLSNFNIVTSSYSEKITISTINKSDYFGDIEVIFQIPRKYSAEARRNCEILSMKRFVLSNLKKEYFPIWDEMRNLAIERDRRNLTTQAKKIKNTRKFIRKTLMLSEVKKQNPSLNDLAEQITYLYEVAEGFHKKFEKIQKYVETKAKVPASMSDDEH
jgi:CRP-like cAMP-binding protein